MRIEDNTGQGLLPQALLTISAPQPLSELLLQIVKWGADLIQGTGCSLYLYDPDSREGRCAAVFQATPEPVGEWQALSLADPAPTSLPSAAPLLYVPLQWEGQVIGMLCGVAHPSRLGFTPQEEATFLTFARHVAAALENGRALEQAQRQQQRLAALYRIALATGGVMQADLLLERLYEEVQRLIEPDGVVIALSEQGGAALRVALMRVNGSSLASLVDRSFPIEDGGISGWIIRSGQSVHVGDMENESLPVAPRRFSARTVHSWLGVPLIVHGKILGSISINSFQRHAYTDSDRLFLEAIASQVAVALNHAQLFEAVQQRAAELEAIHRATLGLTSSLDPKAVLDEVLSATLALLPDVKNAHIFLYQEGQLYLGASLWLNGQRDVLFSEPRPAGLTYSVTRSGEVIIVPNVQQHEMYGQTGWEGALIGLPLKAHNRVVGVMNVAFAHPRTPAPGEMTLLRLLADQAAIAIANARLFDDATQRAAELEAVRQTSLSLTTNLESAQVLDLILEQVLGLLPGSHDAHIFLYNGSHLTFGAAMWVDKETPQKPWSTLRPQGLTYRVARSGRTVVVSDISRHPLFKDAPASWEGAIVGLPLKMGSRVVGVMNIYYAEPRLFKGSELRRLKLLGEQAAVAIENAQLHELATQQARTDALTRLPNRRALDERLHQELSRAERYQRSLALIMMDLNGFKQVNDTYGHPVGDYVLQQVAHRLQEGTRQSDFLARYGGDEFALLMPETSLEEVQQALAKLEDLFYARSLDTGREPIYLSLCLGYAVYPEQARDARELLYMADQQLYYVKRQRTGTLRR